MPDPNTRFYLSADASEIVDHQTGRRWSASQALRTMFANDRARIAMDEGLDPRGYNSPAGGSAMPMYDQNGDPGNNGGNGDIAAAMAQVKAIMRALGNEARGPFISAFQAFLESDEDLDGPPDNNNGATDRRGGKDGTLRIAHGNDRRPTSRGGAPPSMDAAFNAGSFQSRWGKLVGHIDPGFAYPQRGR